jgi:hypothetical protein
MTEVVVARKYWFRGLRQWACPIGLGRIGCGKFFLYTVSRGCGTQVFVHTRLLEVGALKPDNYRSCSSWVDCTPIDLRSRHPSITEQDFLLMDEDKNREMWDVISLSLVLNFVPEPKDRGAMHSTVHASYP